MNDHEFLTAFEAGTLTAFPHRDHIRMAWLYLTDTGWAGGLRSIREGIQHLAAVKGASDKYHETITVFWARLVQNAIEQQPDLIDFESFIRANPHLLDPQIIKQHYSSDVLWSDAARHEWVEPDVLPLNAAI